MGLIAVLDRINTHLSIRGRMRIVSGLMVLPVAVTGWLLFETHMTTIDFARTETVGTRQVGALWPFVTAGALDAQPASQDVSELKATTTGPVTFITAGDADGLAGRTGEALSSGSQDLLTKVSDASNLTLDPDLDSFYMMDAVTVRLPGLVAAADRLEDAHTTGMDDAEQRVAADAFTTAVAALKADVEKSAVHMADRDQAARAVAAISALCDQAAAFARVPNQATMTQLIDQATPVFVQSNDDLARLLKARMSHEYVQMVGELGVAGLVLLLALALNFIIGNGLSRRLTVLSGLMQALIKGEAITDIPFASDRFETGVIVTTLRAFRDTLAEAETMRQVQHQLEEDGINARRCAMLDLADEFERSLMSIVDDLGHSADGLGRTAEDLTTDAEQTSARSRMVASSMDAASNNVQSVAGATEEMAASSHEIADRAQRAADAAEGATRQANDAMAVVEEMNSAADSIGHAVELIAKITSQTNLLALNATIEAARAGESGRGFSVVAAEVKALAQQTSRATEEINRQVKGVQEATAHAATAMRAISLSVIEMKAIAQGISESVAQQTLAVGEISQSTSAVARSTAEISGAVTEVRDTAGYTGERARDALKEARRVADQARALRQSAEGFLAGVRVA